MNRIDRLFGILTHLQSRKYTSAEALSERFGISIRTVYRDVKALCEQGIPVTFEPGRGYCLVQGYFLPPVSFTNEEAQALLLLGQLAGTFTDRSIREHAATAITKVKAVLRGSQREQAEHLEERMHVQAPSCVISSAAHLTAIQQAMTSRSVIRIQYAKNNGEASTRDVEPIGLVFYALYWHLIGWCHLRGEYRDFRVSRIQSLCITGQLFTKAEHLPLSEYLKQLPVPY